MPPGADTVVIQELTARDGDTRRDRQVRRRKAQQCSRRQGIDFARGECCSRKAAALPTAICARRRDESSRRVPVHRAPKIAVLGTGDELVAPGTDAEARRDRLFQRLCTHARMARSEGARGDRPRHRAATASRKSPRPSAARATSAPIFWSPSAALRSATMIWCSRRWTAEGLDLSFWQVALRPGRPMMHGRLGACRCSACRAIRSPPYVCAFLFLVPLIRRLAGPQRIRAGLESAVLGRDLPANDERADYLRATLAEGPDGADRHPLPGSGQFHAGSAGRSRLPADSRAPRAGRRERFSRCVILKLGL